MSEFQDCGDEIVDSRLRVLLEVHRGDTWIPIRIACDFPTVRAAINALPVFAKQQKVEIDDTRVKHLRSWSEVFVAQKAIDRVNQVGGVGE